MTTLITGDIHLNPNPRDAYRHVFMAETLPALVRKYNVTRLIILGDLTDDKDKHTSRLVNQVVTYLHKLASAFCPVLIPTGNHDYTDPEHPFFAFVNMLPDVCWINTPTEQGDTLFLPHTSNWKRDWKDRDFAGYRCIFAHQTFQGASIGPRKMEGIPLSIFPDNAWIISGDIHVPQTFDVVTYVGAPYLVDFGDDYKPRVLILNEDYTYKSIAVPGVQKRLIEVASVTDLDRAAEGFRKGDILKVRVQLRSTDTARWPTVQKQVRDWGTERGFQVFIVQPVVTQQKGVAAARRQVDTRTDQELVKTYGGAKAISSLTLKTGLELTEKG